jgi:hypothetical protein
MFPFAHAFNTIVHPSGTSVGADYTSLATAMAASASGDRILHIGTTTEAANVEMLSDRMVYCHQSTLSFDSGYCLNFDNSDVVMEGNLTLAGKGTSGSGRLIDGDLTAENVDAERCLIILNPDHSDAHTTEIVYGAWLGGNYNKWNVQCVTESVNITGQACYMVIVAGSNNKVQVLVHDITTSNATITRGFRIAGDRNNVEAAIYDIDDTTASAVANGVRIDAGADDNTIWGYSKDNGTASGIDDLGTNNYITALNVA